MKQKTLQREIWTPNGRDGGEFHVWTPNRLYERPRQGVDGTPHAARTRALVPAFRRFSSLVKKNDVSLNMQTVPKAPSVV